jgi:hypothetical protein
VKRENGFFVALGMSVGIVSLIGLLAWSPRWEDPLLPRAGIHGDGVGLQVCVKEVDALGNETLLGTNVLTHFPAATATRDQFAVNVSRMANDIVGPRSPYLLDVAMMKFVNKGAAVEAQSMTCIAAAAIYDTKGRFIDCMTVASAGCTVCHVKAIK